MLVALWAFVEDGNETFMTCLLHFFLIIHVKISRFYIKRFGKCWALFNFRFPISEIFHQPYRYDYSSTFKNFYWITVDLQCCAMAPHSSTLAWKIPWTEEPGGLQSMGSLGVRHDWATSLSLLTFTHWRRKWPPTPVFLPGESQRQRSLVGCRLWGRTASDTTEAT